MAIVMKQNRWGFMVNMNRKLKVLMFTIANTKGGHSQYCLNNYKFINPEKIQMDFITFSKHISYESEIEERGGRIIYLKNHPSKNREEFIIEFSKVLEQKYDVIHLHTSYWADTIVEELAHKFKIPRIIIHAHSTGIGNTAPKFAKDVLDRHYKIRDSIDVSLATDFWACSKEAGDWLYGDRIPKERIRIINNAVDTDRFRFNSLRRNSMRLENNLEDCQVVGFVGRLEQPKNVEFIMELANVLITDDNNVDFLIVGEGSKRGYIEEKIDEYNLNGRVQLVGFQSNIEDWLQAMDVFILPSYFEGFPLVLIEAQVSGLKCLASRNMSEKVVLTDNIELLDLNLDLWKNKILEYSRGYLRISQRELVKNKGYDIKEQAHKLEEEYLIDA